MKRKLLYIINFYGINNQQRKLQEEMFELQEAITKYEYNNCYSIESIIEELADVQVLLDQIRFYYGIEWIEKNRVMVDKIERQIERINSE